MFAGYSIERFANLACGQNPASYHSEFWPDESRDLFRTIFCTGVCHRLQQSHKPADADGRDDRGREGSQNYLCRSGVANDADDHHHTAHQQSAGPAPRTSIEYDLIDMHWIQICDNEFCLRDRVVQSDEAILVVHSEYCLVQRQAAPRS
jgi:hypothetical protein